MSFTNKIKGKLSLFFSLLGVGILILLSELMDRSYLKGEAYYRVLGIDITERTYYGLRTFIEFGGISLFWVIGILVAINIWQFSKVYLFPRLKYGINVVRSNAQHKAQNDALDRMLKLSKLKDQGVLSEQEYEQKLKELKKLL